MNIASIVIPTTAPSVDIPWPLIGAAAIFALAGIALWKTTIGKILIITAVVIFGTKILL